MSMLTRVVPTIRGVPGEIRPSTAARLATVAALVVVTAVVAVATRTGHGLEVAGAAVAAMAILVSFRWPLLPLFALAVLIPVEQAVTIEGLGTLSRYAELAFILVYGIPRLGRHVYRAMPIAGYGYAAWAIVSVAWAIDSSTTWTQITPLVLLVIVAVLIASAVAENPAIVRPLLWVYSVSAAGTALLAIANLGGSEGGRSAALTNQDPALFAAILVPALIFGFSEMVSGTWVVPSTVIVLLSTVGIVVSGTRSAWLGVVVVFAIFVIPRLEFRRRIAAVAIAVAVIVVTIQIPGVADLIGERANSALVSGGAGRTDIWTIGLAIFASSPWIGVGLANFTVANTAEIARQAPLPITSEADLVNFAPHNILIGTLGELGIIGIVLLLAFLLPLVIRRGWGPDGAVVQAIMASLLVIGFFLDVLVRKEFWFFVGLASGLTYLATHGFPIRRREVEMVAPDELGPPSPVVLPEPGT